jgi:hypothetical protein
MGSWTGLICFRIGTGAGFCEGGNEPSKFYSVDQLKNVMDEDCSTYEGEERCIQIFGAET